MVILGTAVRFCLAIGGVFSALWTCIDVGMAARVLETSIRSGREMMLESTVARGPAWRNERKGSSSNHYGWVT